MRKVGTVLGRDANKLGHAAEDASRAGHKSPGSDPAHPSTTPHQADSHSAGVFDQIGKSLGDVSSDLRNRIDDLADWAASRKYDTTSVSSVVPTPIAQPSVLRPVQPPPPRPTTPPPYGTPERSSYDVGERIQRSIEDNLKFKEQMRQGFPERDNSIANRLEPESNQPAEPQHPTDPEEQGKAHEPDHRPEAEDRNLLADNADVRADIDHTAAVKDLDLGTIHEDAVWRTTNEELHRVDSRDLDELFKEGLQPRNGDIAHINQMIDENAQSGWVSTTRNEDLRENHGISGLGDKDTFSVLKLDAHGGVDVEASFPYTRYLKEEEIAFPGGVARSRIRGGYLVRVNPDGSREIVLGSWRDNPNYEP